MRGDAGTSEDRSGWHRSLYDRARYYDIAFDFRDVPKQGARLRELARRGLGRPPRRFLELAAGPARHSVEMASEGLQATALDRSQEMADYGRGLARAAGVDIDYRVGDMRGFELDGCVDLAAILMDSTSYLLDNDDMLEHLACVADHLVAGGIYVMEMGHPRDVFRVGTSAHTDWTMERDGVSVHTVWGREGDPFDPTTQITEATVTLEFQDGSEQGTIVEKAPQRCFTANELRALVTASGRFEMVGCLGSLDADVPFSNDPAAWRMVPVLQRTEGGPRRSGFLP